MPKQQPEENLPNKQGFGKGGSKSKQHLTAHEILRRTEWLDDTPVYWSGVNSQGFEVTGNSLTDFRSIEWVIEANLTGKQRGLYAVKIDHNEGLNPKISTRQVTTNTLASATHSIKVANYRIKELERTVGNLTDWQTGKTERLQIYRSATQALKANSPELEQLMWVGCEKQRPSRVLSDEQLVEFLRSESNQTVELCSGQRNLYIPKNRQSIWHQLGRVLHHWPIDILSRLSNPHQTFADIKSSEVRQEAINTQQAILLIRERFPSGGITQLLSTFIEISDLNDTVSITRNELQKRVSVVSAIHLSIYPNSKTTFIDPGFWSQDTSKVIKEKLQRTYGQQFPRQKSPRGIRNHIFGYRIAGRKAPYLDAANFDGLRDSLYGLSGRFSKLQNSTSTWMEACNYWCAPGRDGCDVIRLAVSSIEITRGSYLLGQFGHQFLRCHIDASFQIPNFAHWLGKIEKNLKVLPQFKALSASETEAIFSTSATFSKVFDLANKSPSMLPHILAWLKWDRHLIGATSLCKINDPILIGDILNWAQGLDPLVNKNGVFAILGSFVEDYGKPAIKFLRRNFWILERTEPYLDDSEMIEWWENTLLTCLRWDDNGPTALTPVIDAMTLYGKKAIANNSHNYWYDDQLPLLVELCNKDPEHLVRLIKQWNQSALQSVNANTGLKQIEPFPNFNQVLQSAALKVERLPIIVRILKRIPLIVRIGHQTVLQEIEKTLVNAKQCPPYGDWNVADQLAEIQYIRKNSDQGATLPKPILKILNRATAIERELEFLDAKKAELNERQTQRLAKLTEWAENPDETISWQEQDLAQCVDKHLLAAQLHFVQSYSRYSVVRHWQQYLPDSNVDIDNPDWENAILFSSSITENRRILKKLLRARSVGDMDWALQHGANQKYLEKMQRYPKFQQQAWLAPYKLGYQTQYDNWTLTKETDPLKVLQMGNYFGTCLSLEGCNDFSVVANAVEVNKQVLFLWNSKGVAIGRKLIFFIPTDTGPVLYGCHTYGTGYEEDPNAKPDEIKLIFNIACLEIAKAAGIRLSSAEEIDESWQADETLEERAFIFARWYYDGVEYFDWWAVELSSGSELEAVKQKAIAITKQQSKTHRDFIAAKRFLHWQERM